MELIQRCLTDDERTDSLVKLAFGLVGDLADSFPNGQLKQVLLQEWIATELRNRRGLSPEAKKTMRWAKEVG
jgi:importin subunit beta-1